jgi:phage repressor protein C with HTH and peptisase S24 domain
MLYGKGVPFGIDLDRPDASGFSFEGREGPLGNILYTSTEAFAGVSIDAGSFVQEENEYFSIPGISGTGLVAFPINGNSMEPIIQDGDIVICKQIDSLSALKDNKIYAVKNNGSVWVKYIQRLSDKPNVLKLISANHLEYDPFEEEINEYTRLYEVVRKISNL